MRHTFLFQPKAHANLNSTIYLQSPSIIVEFLFIYFFHPFAVEVFE